MKKLKVLHVINNLEVGGAERVLYLILQELSAYPDLDITLVSLEGHGSLENDFRQLPINFKKFKYHLFIPIFRKFEPYFRFRLWLFALKLRPDVIHGHLIKGEDFAKVLGALLSCPVITTSHDSLVRPGKKQRWLNRYLTRATAVSAAVSKHLQEYYGIPEDKIIVIPDAIKVEDYRKSTKKWDSSKPVFIYTGRLIELKGVQFAIRGLLKLKGEYPGIKFYIYGDGNYRPALEKFVNENKADFVVFKGRVANLPEAYKSGDIFVLPSRSEGFSMATLEAAASGKPLLATKTGAIADMLIEGKNGYFIKYGEPDSIYLGAKTIIEGDVPGMGKKSMGIAVGHFAIEYIAKKYYNLYLRVTKK